jgi:hypothetical protein
MTTGPVAIRSRPDCWLRRTSTAAKGCNVRNLIHPPSGPHRTRRREMASELERCGGHVGPSITLAGWTSHRLVGRDSDVILAWPFAPMCPLAVLADALADKVALSMTRECIGICGVKLTGVRSGLIDGTISKLTE